MAKSSPDRLIDPDHTTCLCDVGAPEYAAVVAVDANGDEWYLLARKDMIGAPYQDVGNPEPPHEQLGRLPREYRDALWGDALRCGRPTWAGKPCRARVAEPGGVCANHREPRS